MHGLIFCTLKSFVQETYGGTIWEETIARADVANQTFEPMLNYERGQLDAILDAAVLVLGKPRITLLEDVGIYVIAGSDVARYLLRFSGETFLDFLLLLDELPGRIRLAIPDLELPAISVVQHGQGQLEVRCGPGIPGFSYVLTGAIRAMADDYGTLVTIESGGAPGTLLLNVHGAVVCSATEHALNGSHA